MIESARHDFETSVSRSSRATLCSQQSSPIHAHALNKATCTTNFIFVAWFQQASRVYHSTALFPMVSGDWIVKMFPLVPGLFSSRHKPAQYTHRFGKSALIASSHELLRRCVTNTQKMHDDARYCVQHPELVSCNPGYASQTAGQTTALRKAYIAETTRTWRQEAARQSCKRAMEVRASLLPLKTTIHSSALDSFQCNVCRHW